MNLDKVQKGKKYYHQKCIDVKDRITGKRERHFYIYFVVEVNIPGNYVLASINRGRIQKFTKAKVARWREAMPLEMLQHLKKVAEASTEKI
jgi:hypothetical protein